MLGQEAIQNQGNIDFARAQVEQELYRQTQDERINDMAAYYDHQ